MRAPLVGAALACTLVLGCGLLKKKKAPAVQEESVATASTVTVSGTGAKNEKDVLRYANETPLADEPGVIGRDGGIKAKTFPGSGADIALIPKGAVVVKKAKFFSTGVLVLFDDPANDGTRLMGWIPPEAFGTATAATAAATFTAPRSVPTVAPTAKDAGVVAVDAGKPADAGAVAPAALLQVNPIAGKCPAGFALTPPFCRRPCNVDRDCPANSVCAVTGGPKKTCAATH